MSSEVRNYVDKLQFRLEAMKLENLGLTLPQSTLDVVNNVVPGLYVRSCKLPKGLVVTGAIFKKWHICIAIGRMTVIDEDGTHEYNGIDVFNSRPGIKRVLRVHEDSLFITVHRTDEKTVYDIVHEQTADTYAEFETYLENQEVLP